MKDHADASPSEGFDPFDLNKPHAKWEQLRKEEPFVGNESIVVQGVSVAVDVSDLG